MHGLQTYEPALFAGFGTGLILALSDYGQGVTTATNNIDQYVVPVCALNDRTNKSLRIGAVCFTVNSFGTGATAGSWTLALAINGVVQSTLTASIAYNASSPIANINVSGVTAQGYPLNQGDIISLSVTGVPTGTLSGGAKGIKARVFLEGYGVNA